MTELKNPGDNRIVDQYYSQHRDRYFIQYEYIELDGTPTFFLAMGDDRPDAERDWADFYLKRFNKKGW